MGRKLVVLTMVIGLLVAASYTSAVAGFGAGQAPVEPRGPQWEEYGPPDFVREMNRLGTSVMARERIRVRNSMLESDLPPVIKDGRVLIPVRAVTNALGAAVDWDPDNHKVTITRGDITIILYLDELVFYVNGEVHELDVPGRILANRTFVPLRFIAQALGERVFWDQAQGTVEIGEEEDE